MYKHKCYEMTKHPRIFKDTYWGRFDAKDDELESGIFENRNEFVEKNGITKLADCPILGCKPEKYRLFDHCELYKTNDGFLLIASPYVGDDSENFITEKFHSFGFEVLPPLYHPSAKTFLRKFENMKQVKKFTETTN